jgi:hypothetical protein
MFRGNAFIAFAPYRPITFIGHYMLVLRAFSFALAGTVKEDFYQFNNNGNPRFRSVAFGHGRLFISDKILF